MTGKPLLRALGKQFQVWIESLVPSGIRHFRQHLRQKGRLRTVKEAVHSCPQFLVQMQLNRLRPVGSSNSGRLAAILPAPSPIGIAAVEPESLTPTRLKQFSENTALEAF